MLSYSAIRGADDLGYCSGREIFVIGFQYRDGVFPSPWSGLLKYLRVAESD